MSLYQFEAGLIAGSCLASATWLLVHEIRDRRHHRRVVEQFDRTMRDLGYEPDTGRWT